MYHQVVSVEYAAFISWNHVFDVNEGVFSTCLLQQLQGLSNQVTQVESLPLVVLYLVGDVDIIVAEDIEDRQDLSVVGHKGLAYHLP